MKRLLASTWFWVAAALAFAGLGALGAWLEYRPPHPLLVWKPFIFTQHQFDYELEFVKRGLTGEAFRLAGIGRTVEAVSVFSWVVLAAWAALLVRFHRRFSPQPAASTSAVWLAAIVVSPATFLQAGGDLGRLDPLLLVCQLGLLLLTLAVGRWWLLAAVALTGIGVTTHELFLLAQLPLAIAAHVYVGWARPERKQELWRRAVAIAAAAALAAGFVAAWGRMDGTPLDEYIAFLQQQRGLVQPSPEGVSVIYNSLGANIDFAWEKLAAKAPLGIPFAAAVMSIYLALGATSVRKVRANVLLLMVGACGPLLLLVLAYDYGRWFAFATINILLAVSICQQHSAVAVDWKPLRWTLPLALLGPFGVTIGFPWWL